MAELENTSLGYHTFAFFQKEKEDIFNKLETDFMIYAKKNNDIKRFPLENNKGWGYAYKKNKGIRWRLLSYKVQNTYIVHGVMAIVNPKVLIEKNYIAASEEDDLDMVEKIYNSEAAKISPLLSPFGSHSLSRVDPCLNIDLKELRIPCTPEQMMVLIKQGNIPKHYKERDEKYDEKQHRRVKDKNSFYLESKSATINYYWKYPKQDEKHPNYAFRELSRNVIRLEVQCKYLKLYPLSQNIRHKSKFHISDEKLSIDGIYEMLINETRSPSIPIDVMLSEEVYDNLIRKDFYRILRKGDYFTLDGARSIVESYQFRNDKEERIIHALELVKESHGIAKAKSKLHGPDLTDFNRSLKDLDDMLINPVTIPRRWNIKYIPNLLRAYDDAKYEEWILIDKEGLAWKHIEEYLFK